jgi:hypothetical protein
MIGLQQSDWQRMFELSIMLIGFHGGPDGPK